MFFIQIVTNVVVQIIILLYLIDNNEQTSWMILMGSGIGVLIEAWKVSIVSVSVCVPGSLTSLCTCTPDHEGCRYQYRSIFTGVHLAIPD